VNSYISYKFKKINKFKRELVVLKVFSGEERTLALLKFLSGIARSIK
jgi:hypothetical protein